MRHPTTLSWLEDRHYDWLDRTLKARRAFRIAAIRSGIVKARDRQRVWNAYYETGILPPRYPVPALRYECEIGEEYCEAIEPHALDWNALEGRS